MRKLYALFTLGLLPFFIQAQITWNFATATPSSGTPVANISSVSDVSQGNNNGTTALITTASASSGYTGATGGNNAGAAARVGALVAGTGGSAYFEFTLTPDAGYAINITKIDFGSRSTGTGPQAFDIRTDLDNYASALATATLTNNGTWSLQSRTFSFSGGTGTPVIVRIYGYNGAGGAVTGTANWRIDDLAVTATASSAGPVPTINIAPSLLSGFTTTNGTPSASQTFTAGGTDLSIDITIAPPSQFEISTDDVTYSTSINLTPTAGAVSNTTIYVRIAATALVGTANGDITLITVGGSNKTVSLTGNVSSSVVVNPPQAFAATASSSSQIDLTATGNVAVDNIVVAFNTTPTFGAPIGSLAPGNSIAGGGTVLYSGPSAGFNFPHTGLNPATIYYYSAWSVDGSSNYSTALTANATTNTPASANVVINQIYGGGGNSGATYKNDFIELYNNENTPVNLAGWSVQYSSAAGTGTWAVTPLTGTIPAHSFFLIQQAVGTGGTVNLPTPDAIGSLALSATAGKVILSNSTTAQTGANPSGVSVIDKVGYGATATGFETAPAAGTANTTGIVRIVDGVDNNNNNTDFAVGSPNPRNATYTSAAPVITSLTPPNGRTDIPYNIVPSITFSKSVIKGVGNISIFDNGVLLSAIDVNSSFVTVSDNVATITTTLVGNKSYHIEITAGAFKDVYNNNFAGITNNTDWAFGTYNPASSTTVPVTFDLQNCNGSGLLPNGFTQYSSSGAIVWDCTTFGRDPVAPANSTAAYPNGIQMNGYDNAVGSNVPNVDWLISPSLDLTGTVYPLLSFYSRTRFNGLPLVLKVSTDYSGTGDPALATWTDINGKFPQPTTDTWTLSSNINLSNFKQSNVHIAFVYTSSDDDGARWTMDDIALINSLTPPPPSLTLSSNDIQFFYTAATSTSVKNFSITGNDLTGDITFTTNGSFLVSTDNISFTTTATLTQAEASNLTKTIYVQFAPATANQNYNGTVTVSTAGVTDVVVSTKGTSIDPARTLEVVNWNMEWFGSSDPTLGPVNKVQQKENMRTILPAIDADLYALVEVVDTSALGTIVRDNMPGYGYIICNYGSHANPFESGASPMGAVQKEAFVYRKSVFTNIDTSALLSVGVNTMADLSNPDYNNWSSGRYPFMMKADVTLDGVTKTIRFVTVHAKANTSPTLISYNRRKAGADNLHAYLNGAYPTDNIMILGDFNDDLDVTITDGIAPPTSSYSAFTDDVANFGSPTLTYLSLNGKQSTVGYNQMIDHVVLSNELQPFFMNSSAAVLTDVTSLVTNYASTTTDHYPVFTRYAFDAAILPVKLEDFSVTKQANTVKVAWKTSEEINSRQFVVERAADGISFNSIGTVPAKGIAASYSFFDDKPLTGYSYYRLKMVDNDEKSAYSKVVRVNFEQQLVVKISPNPASTQVNITLGASNRPVIVQMTDMNGKLVKQASATGRQNISLDINGLPKGLYTIKLIGTSENSIHKLIIQ